MAKGFTLGVAERFGRASVGGGLLSVGPEKLSHGRGAADRGNYPFGDYPFLDLFGGGAANVEIFAGRNHCGDRSSGAGFRREALNEYLFEWKDRSRGTSDGLGFGPRLPL